MEQYNNKCSPPAPASPRRHIHSSFPHYFYSTPAAPPSSDSISAFVVLCEARLVAAADDDFAFGSSNRHASLETVPPVATVAFADDLFRGGMLLPIAPKAAAAAATTTTAAPAQQPLRLPPRLQYIANIRKSLRNLRRPSRGGTTKKASNARKINAADPFAAAADKVAKEDAPWCQLPWRRKSKAAAKADGEDIDDGAAATSKNRKKGSSWIFRLLRSALKGKESKSSSDSKEEDGKSGQLVGLVRSTTVSRYRNTQYGSSLLNCFGFK